MDDDRVQAIGHYADADDEEEEVDDVDQEEMDIADRGGEDEDENEEVEEEEGNEEEEENEDDNEHDGMLWVYSDSDDSQPDGAFFNHSNDQYELWAASLVPMEKNEVELQEGIWDSLPEEILSNILVRLPVATQCRFRCVCSRWKLMLSAPSSARRQVSEVESRQLCIIMSETQRSESRFYCHAEDKWYRIPFRPESRVDMKWRLRAADGGLVCYRSCSGGPEWLLVCNPITGACQIVPPCPPDPLASCSLQHFIVDKEVHSFTIVTMSYQEIMYFDSKTQLWNRCSRSGPGFHVKDNDLVRRSIIYSQFQQFSWYQAFGLKSEDYKTIQANLPCDAGKPYRIICSKGYVMLVQFRPREEDPIQIWKLVTEDAPALWLSRWEAVAVEVPASLRPLVEQIQDCWSHGNDVISFATVWTHHWMQYALATKTWRVMPCTGKVRPLPDSEMEFCGFYKWLHWEPCLNTHVDAVESDFKRLAAVAASQRQRVTDANNALFEENNALF